MKKIKKIKVKKPKYAEGAMLQQYGGPIGTFASGALDMAFPGDEYGVRDDGSAIGSGALKGAAGGAALGPIGAGVGALVGGIGGALGNDQAKKAKTAAQERQRFLTQQMLLNNTSPQKMAKGGKLAQISPDAVQVKANNPSKTDSVDIGPAYVDNNEIIDNKNRVFSDDLKMPSGRSIASEAKRLEKMKSKSSRFTDANKFVDSKLDKLFSFQETNKEHLADGGNIGRKAGAASSADKSGTAVAGSGWDQFKSNLKDTWDGKKNALNPSSSTQYKAARAKGGKLRMSLAGQLPDAPQFVADPSKMATTISKNPQINYYGKQGSGFDMNKAGTQLATYLPNLINLGLTSQIPPAPEPTLEPRVDLQRVNANDQLAENSRQANNAGRQLSQSTAQAGNVASGKGSILARRFYADNAVHGDVNRQNAQIQGNEAFLNQGVKARNTDRTNMQKFQNVERKGKQLSAYSNTLSNVGEKVLMQGRERNFKDRDLAELDVLKKAYGDSGVYGRNFENSMDEYMKRKGISKPKGRKGGWLMIPDKGGRKLRGSLITDKLWQLG